MFRETCYTCRRPRAFCLCPADPPMPTRTRIVLLMHLQEVRHQKSNTGLLTRLNLANCEIVEGLGFDDDPRVRALVDDPGNFPVLLYPGEGALRLEDASLGPSWLRGRRLVVFLLDGTWSNAYKSLRDSPRLSRLPRLAISPRAPSRFVIKRQPHAWCLSTIEATHELLLALEDAGLDDYPDKVRLLAAFDRMQKTQIECAARGNPRRLMRRSPAT